jgi:Asp-tRNA(Asn)/Glu-tRNA(Gln) amidotransferase A subunit family amidase
MSSSSLNPDFLNELPATALSELISAGQCSAVDLAEACLRRINKRESEVGAWAYIDPEKVLAQARTRDNESRRGVLHGIPVGIKDIMHTSDMPTQFGSPIYRGHQPVDDASCVSLLRDAGCVIMGKTETMEFAICHPARTHNPKYLAHTPGGSSSGSAAAVADFMCPLGLGTQTGASIIRPASYCGVV